MSKAEELAQPVQQETALAMQYLALCDAMGYSYRKDSLQSPEEFAKALASKNQEPPQQERQIAEALRRRGLTLVKTANGYDVLGLGEITAQASGPQPVERKPKRHACDDPLCAVCGHHIR